MSRIVSCVLVGLLFAGLPLSNFASASEEIRDREKVLRVQTILYEWNWGDDEAVPDGLIGPKTRNMIRAYQEARELPVTGILSPALHQYLVENYEPDKDVRWGAISASTDRAYYAVWNYSTRKQAYQDALRGCRQRSSRPSYCSTVVNPDWGDDDEQWIAATHCRKRGQSRVSLVSRSTLRETTERAYEYATEDGTYTHSMCRILVTIAADGSHE